MSAAAAVRTAAERRRKALGTARMVRDDRPESSTGMEVETRRRLKSARSV